MTAERKVAISIAAHPDDIEFMQAGTLILLKEAGWEVHYLNISNGHCGSATMDEAETVRVRCEEAKNAAAFIGATWHPTISRDIEIFHTPDMIRQVCAIIREVRPRILLTQSPADYMEDHMNATRIAVTAAFCRGMRNYPSTPDLAPTFDPVTIYHALPYGLTDGLRRRIRPGQYVDIASVVEKKKAMLEMHVSQRQWLDDSQGMDAYTATQIDMSRDVGAMSQKFEYAEGWRRHSHLGFTDTDTDPLTDALGGKVWTDPDYEAALQQGHIA